MAPAPLLARLVAHPRATVAVLAGALLVALALPASGTEGAAVAGLAAVAIAVSAWAVAARVGLAPSPRAVRIGGRDERHRESLDRVAEPSHPDTTGRVRERAPGAALPAA